MFNKAANQLWQGQSKKGCEQPSSSGSEQIKDEELITLIIKKNRRAATELVNRYQKKTYSMAYQMCSGDREEAQDLTQEAFLQVFRNLKQFRGQSSFKTWFYRIIVNTCLDRRRSRQRWKRLFSLWSSESGNLGQSHNFFEEQPDTKEKHNPLKLLNGKELQHEIQGTLLTLPEKQRMAFHLKVFNEMSIKEIAQIMNLAEGTVKSHLFRATQYMQGALKNWITP